MPFLLQGVLQLEAGIPKRITDQEGQGDEVIDELLVEILPSETATVRFAARSNVATEGQLEGHPLPAGGPRTVRVHHLSELYFVANANCRVYWIADTR